MRAVKPALLVVLSLPIALAVSLFARSLEWSFYDARLALRTDGGWPSDLVLVPVDATALAALGGWPLPAESAAALVDGAAKAGAKTVVLDVFFGETDDEALLAGSLAHVPVVTSVLFDPEHGRNPSADELAAAMVPAEAGPRVPAGVVAFPTERLTAAAARLGHAGFRESADGAVRSTPSLVRVEGYPGAVPSQPLAALLVHRAIDPKTVAVSFSSLSLHVGAHRVALDAGETLLDLVPGAPGPREVPVASVLDGSATLAGALVVIHVDTPEDRHRSPLGETTPGGVLLASAIRTLDGGRAPRRLPLLASIAIAGALAGGATLASSRSRRTLAMSAAALGWLLAAFALVPLADLFLPLVPAAIVFAAGLAGAFLRPAE